MKQLEISQLLIQLICKNATSYIWLKDLIIVIIENWARECDFKGKIAVEFQRRLHNLFI